MRLRLLVLPLGLLIPLAVPGVAWADPPVVHEHIRESYPPPGEEVDPISCQVGNREVLFDERSTYRSHFLVKPAKDGLGQAFLAHDNYRFEATHTNLSNGRTFTVRFHGLFKERTAELIPNWQPPPGWTPPLDENGDPITVIGPVYRFTAINNVHAMVRDYRGRVIYKAHGRIFQEIVFDTRGDRAPGGIPLIEEEPVVLSGTMPDFDFCEVALAATR